MAGGCGLWWRRRGCWRDVNYGLLWRLAGPNWANTLAVRQQAAPSPPLPPLPQISILSALYIATGALSEILTNNAAAALMYPIASVAGERLGEHACVCLYVVCVCVCVCAHACMCINARVCASMCIDPSLLVAASTRPGLHAEQASVPPT